MLYDIIITGAIIYCQYHVSPRTTYITGRHSFEAQVYSRQEIDKKERGNDKEGKYRFG